MDIHRLYGLHHAWEHDWFIQSSNKACARSTITCKASMPSVLWGRATIGEITGASSLNSERAWKYLSSIAQINETNVNSRWVDLYEDEVMLELIDRHSGWSCMWWHSSGFSVLFCSSVYVEQGLIDSASSLQWILRIAWMESGIICTSFIFALSLCCLSACHDAFDPFQSLLPARLASVQNLLLELYTLHI